MKLIHHNEQSKFWAHPGTPDWNRRYDELYLQFGNRHEAESLVIAEMQREQETLLKRLAVLKEQGHQFQLSLN